MSIAKMLVIAMSVLGFATAAIAEEPVPAGQESMPGHDQMAEKHGEADRAPAKKKGAKKKGKKKGKKKHH